MTQAPDATTPAESDPTVTGPTVTGNPESGPTESGPARSGPVSAGPAWVSHAIWWHVYPLGFVGAVPATSPPEPAPRIHHLSSYLDYVVELGANGLLLGPIFESESHGYDTRDHFTLDPRLGTQQDFEWFMAAAKERGVRVLLDGVFNHVGRSFAQFQAALHDPEVAADWFVPTSAPGTMPQHFHCFEGHDALVTLNHASERVLDHVVAVMEHWLALGVDGWRLDAAYAVPAEFWQRAILRVRERYPEAYFVGEVIHGDYPAIVLETGMDSVTQYELWHGIFNSINEENFYELEWSLRRHNMFLEHFVPQTFIGNHDVTRIASRLGDPRHLDHAYTLLFTLGGTPSIYYGDEQGFEGLKEERAGGDDAIRPLFPSEPEGGASALPRAGWGTYRLHQKLVSVRRRHPWLHTARSEVRFLSNSGLALEVSGGGERLYVVLNLSDDDLWVELPGAREVLEGLCSVSPEAESQWVKTPPHSCGIIK